MALHDDRPAGGSHPPLNGNPFDEEGTVYRNTDSVYSRSDDSDYDGMPAERRRGLPVFRLDKDQGQTPVYEAWSVRQPMNVLAGVKFSRTLLGINFGSYRLGEPDVNQSYFEQEDLANMHLRALEDFQTKHRRGWSSRHLGGKTKTYEQDLDERCRKLPFIVQEVITDLLGARSRESSTPYRKRTWTVVAMHTRERHRFASAEMSEAKRHKLRFWRNNSFDAPELLDYLFIIRGSQTSASKEGNSLVRFGAFENPWLYSDRAEARHRAREERMRREEGRRGNRQPPPSYRAYRGHSQVSEPDFGRQEPRRWEWDGATRTHHPDPAPPSVPMPPASYTPPPPVGRYVVRGRPSVARSSPPPLSRSPSPYYDALPRRPCVQYVVDDGWIQSEPSREPISSHRHRRSAVPSYAPRHFGISDCDADLVPGAEPYFDRPMPPTSCIACRATPDCGHFNQGAVCFRQVNFNGSIATHPPCFICMATAADPVGTREYVAMPPMPAMPPTSPPPTGEKVIAPLNAPQPGMQRFGSVPEQRWFMTCVGATGCNVDENGLPIAPESTSDDGRWDRETAVNRSEDGDDTLAADAAQPKEPKEHKC
ncbi:hypothetical protein B0T25DRAFT_515081 [Lasiosphaeria hispida]|uniref:Uncharacterized protein n=1 Tax=Lasiosphaeria hispida TaxID=260671 RepID=A0AAJ0HR13_9PEZI|nr:hypothetical protein B0T25DRAFT_515081 [Lasiosphaeria hispida]